MYGICLYILLFPITPCLAVAVQPYLSEFQIKKTITKTRHSSGPISKTLFVNRTIFKLFISFQVAATTAAQKCLENPQG